jgi:hypothetical protein
MYLTHKVVFPSLLCVELDFPPERLHCKIQESGLEIYLSETIPYGTDYSTY